MTRPISLRRLWPALLVALGLGILATPGMAAASCLKPSHLRVKVVSPTHVVLSWRTPGIRGHRRLRVLRDGRVIGQTGRRSMRIAVRAGRRHKLSVGIVRAHGLRPLCYARISIRTQPATVQLSTVGAPVLAARVTDADHVTVSWLPIPEAKAYRAQRNGAVIKQTKGLSLTISVVAGRPYQVRVAAVAAGGKLGAWSSPLAIDLAHVAPSSPPGLAVGVATPTSVTVRWSPAQAGSAPVRAYRVYRNGVVVGQTANTWITLGGLAADTGYEVQVAAVDSQGYMSAPVGPMAARTAPPDQSTGKTRLFVLASTQSSINDFESHYRQVSAIFPTYFDCDRGTGLFTGSDTPRLDQFAQARGVRVLPRLNCQGTTLVHNILTNPTMRANAIQSAVTLVQTYRYDGINLDLEAGAAADRALFTQFVTDMAQAIHNVGGTLTVDVSPKTADVPNHPRSTFFDYNSLSRVADEIEVMSWGLHWTTSAPGSVVDIRWFSQVYSYVASLPGRASFVIGVPLYGMDWPSGGGAANPAAELGWSALTSLLQQTGAQPQLDAATDEWHFTYTDGSGTPHDVWYSTPQSLGDHMNLAAQDGLAGIALWRSGQEDPAVWGDSALNPGP
jgi:spore germination protein YaaH